MKCEKNVIKYLYVKNEFNLKVLVVVVVVAIVNNQKSRLILVNMEVLHWRVLVTLNSSILLMSEL